MNSGTKERTGATRVDAPAISVRGVGKTYRGTAQSERDWVLHGVDLDIADGEFFILLGPSGCGKTTLLRMMAGIAEISEGTIMTCEGGPVEGPSRQRGMVFQSIDTPLFEWLTAEQNAEFGLRMDGRHRSGRREQARRFLTMVGLRGHEKKFPSEMSGGMKQRLQIARALATEPSILLMDEPFASVDAQTRRILQSELQRIWLETRTTIVYVTHDIREALLLGQRIAVMTAGPAANIGRIYEHAADYPRDELSEDFLTSYRTIDEHIAREVSHVWA